MILWKHCLQPLKIECNKSAFKYCLQPTIMNHLQALSTASANLSPSCTPESGQGHLLQLSLKVYSITSSKSTRFGPSRCTQSHWSECAQLSLQANPVRLHQSILWLTFQIDIIIPPIYTLLPSSNWIEPILQYQKVNSLHVHLIISFKSTRLLSLSALHYALQLG